MLLFSLTFFHLFSFNGMIFLHLYRIIKTKLFTNITRPCVLKDLTEKICTPSDVSALVLPWQPG